MNDNDVICDCGHEQGLHDPNGCAAFLGSFPGTVEIKRYCTCQRSGSALLSRVHNLLTQGVVVAEVRVRERAGTAIGVCEFPPALELGASPGDVVRAIKARLRAVIAPPNDGSARVLRIVQEHERAASVRVEALW